MKPSPRARVLNPLKQNGDMALTPDVGLSAPARYQPIEAASSARRSVWVAVALRARAVSLKRACDAAGFGELSRRAKLA